MPRPGWLILALALWIGLAAGCARHPIDMSPVRALMAQQQYGPALKEAERICKSDDNVLCLLERGLLLHYEGKYEESNQVFDRAEALTEDLYTRSISREAVAFLTSDLARPYVPKPYEQVLVNYFRALNYMFLGLDEDALVECRKASDKLARYAGDEKRPYRQDAFLEYLTGVLYEWGGEANNALVSYRNALDAYRIYHERFGIPAPDELSCDILRTAGAIGLPEESDSVLAAARERCGRGTGSAKIVVLIEQGFVPALAEWSINVPILKSERDHAHDDPFAFSLEVAPRMYGDYYFDADDIDYFLRVALPYYPDVPALLGPPMLYVDSAAVEPAEAEDVYAIAQAEAKADQPVVFARTLARAIVKYKASDAAGHKWGEVAGKLANLAAAATEQADLRSWLSLPRAVYIATIYVEPGIHAVGLDLPAGQLGGVGAAGEAEGAGGEGVAEGAGGEGAASREVLVDARPGTTSFVRFREY